MSLQALAKLLYKKGSLTAAQWQALAGVSRATAYRILRDQDNPNSDLSLMRDGIRWRKLQAGYNPN